MIDWFTHGHTFIGQLDILATDSAQTISRVDGASVAIYGVYILLKMINTSVFHSLVVEPRSILHFVTSSHSRTCLFAPGRVFVGEKSRT